MHFVAIHHASRAKPIRGTWKFATLGSFEGAGGQWRRIDHTEVELLDFNADALNDGCQALQAQARLDFRGKPGKEIGLQHRPPAAEVHRFMEVLEHRDSHQLCIRNLFVAMDQFLWHLWDQPGRETLEAAGDRR
jgi:hypothetical protein